MSTLLTWVHTIRAIIYILLSLLISLPAFAQNIDLSTLDLNEVQSGPTSNPFGDVDESGFSDLYQNPENLGPCGGEPDCDLYNLIDNGRVPDNFIDGLDDELGDFLTPADPHSIVGDILGLDTVCDPATGRTTADTTERYDYSCNSGWPATDTVTNCFIPLDVTVDPNYQYSCNVPDENICTGNRMGGHYYELVLFEDVSINPNFGRCLTLNFQTSGIANHAEVLCEEPRTFELWTVVNGADCTSAECDILDGMPGCEPQGTECTGTGTQTSIEQCIDGNNVAEGQACQRELVHELEVHFSYDCRFVYDDVTGELSPDPKCYDLGREGSCEETGRDCVQRADHATEDIVCEIGDELTYTDYACEVKKYVRGDPDFHYTGARIWNPGAKTFEWEVDPVSVAGAASAGCVLDEERCLVEAPAIYEYETCKVGYEIVDTSYTCNLDRRITVDTDYVYGTNRTWNAAQQAHIASDNYKATLEASCLSLGESCTVDTPPAYEEVVCLQGYRQLPNAESCEIPRNIVVDTDYGYLGLETYYEDLPGNHSGNPTFVPDRAFTQASNANCTVMSSRCAVPRKQEYDDYVCQQGHTYTYADHVVRRDREVTVDTDYFYKGYENFSTSTQRWTRDAALTSLLADNECELIDQSCTVPSGGVFSAHECTIGYRETYQAQTCDVPLRVTTDTDYVYQDFSNWNAGLGRHVPTPTLTNLRNASVCEMTERICSVQSPGVFEEESCLRGVRESYRAHNGIRTRQITVDEDYLYNADRNWYAASNSHRGTSEWNSLNADGSCEKTASVCAVVTPPSYDFYTCESGYRDTTANMTCDRRREITVDEDYIYSVDRMWSTSRNRWTSTADWNAVRNASQCVRQSETCITPSPGVTTSHTCEQGYRIDDKSMTCDVKLSFTIDTDYRYVGYENWNGTRFVRDTTLTRIDQQKSSRQCVRESIVNEQPASVSDRTSTYACYAGSITYSRQQTCEATLNVTVTSKTGYRYRHRDGYGTGALWNNPQCTFDGFIHIPEPCYGWNCNRLEQRIDNERDWWAKYKCTAPQSGTGLVYMGTYTYYTQSDTISNGTCQSLINSGAPKTAETCIEGRATRTKNGQQVTRDCWKWRRTYGSTTTQSVNSCAPPSGFAYKRQSAISGSPALGTSRSLYKKVYEKVEPLSRAAYVVSSYECWSGYWITASGQRKNYSCSPPSGAQARKTSCAWTDSGETCRLYAKSYTVPNPATPGGYNRKKETWTCQSAVTGSGVASPALIHSNKQWTYDYSQCNSAQNNYSEGCTYQSQAWTGSSVTKTIDGYRHPARQWTLTRNYKCGERVNIDSCGSYAFNFKSKPKTQHAGYETSSGATVIDAVYRPQPSNNYSDLKLPYEDDYHSKPDLNASGKGTLSPPKIMNVDTGDYTYDGRVCVNYEGSTCTLWRKTYKREEVDPSGGCHNEREVWHCENSVTGAGTPQLTHEITSEKWEWPSADCQTKIAQHGSCKYTGQSADRSTGGVRTINGLQVNRSSWVLKRNYTCTTRENINTCRPPAGYSPYDASCVWNDANGVCRLSEQKYRRLKPDPTGGCTKYTDTFRCENRNHGTPDGTTHDITSDKWLQGNTAPYWGNSACKRTSYRWGPPETRVINGLSLNRVWSIDETFECRKETQVDTCTALINAKFGQGANPNHERRKCQQRHRDGSCGVWEYDYRYEVNDPSGGCHQYREEYLCTDRVGGAGTPVATPTEEAGTSRDEAACSSLVAAPECKKLRDVCVEGRATRRINGIDITKSCWKWRYDYECTTRTNIDTCAPKSTATLDTQTCVWSDRNGTCRLFDRVYRNEEHDPSGGCHQREFNYRCEQEKSGLSAYDTIKHVESESFDANPVRERRAQHYECSYVTGSFRTGPRETRIIDGLSLSRYWYGEWTYNCSDREAVDSCELPDHAKYIGEFCAEEYKGSCALRELTYRYPVPNEADGCSVKETQFRCADELQSGSVNKTWKTIVSDTYDFEACEAREAQYDQCQQTSEVCTSGRATRTIDDLAVTRDCWEFERNYTCSNTERFDTCDIPNGASNLEQRCVWSDASGSCRLFESTYDVLLPDPTGGCTTFTEEFRCEETMPVPTLLRNIKHVDEDYYDDRACQRENDGSVCSASERCTGGAGTRNIDGLDVSRECWKLERRNSCTRTDHLDECQHYADLEQIETNCIWADNNGVCRLRENTLRRALDDGSGGCHKWEGQYWCENELPGTLEIDYDRFTVSGVGWDSRECNAVAAQPGCVQTLQRCGDGNPQTRRPERARDLQGNVFEISSSTLIDDYTQDCWVLEREGNCETREPIDSCAGNLGDLCTLDSSHCLQQERGSSCALTRFNYTCGIQGSDYCVTEDVGYTCLGPPPISTATLNLNQNLSGYEPSNIRATVKSTYFDNSECNALASRGQCQLVNTVCDEPGDTGSQPIRRAQDSYYQQFIEYADPQLEACWKQRRIYECAAPEGIYACSDQSERCDFNADNCLFEDADGNCLITQNNYTCTVETDSCESTSETYICDDEVPGMDTSGEADPDITSEYNMSECDAAEQTSAQCGEPAVRCVGPGEIRLIEGYEVEADCWEYERTYECTELGDYETDCDVPEGCEQTNESCIGFAPDGTCLTYDHEYECSVTTTEVVAQGEPGTCETNSTPPADRPANQNISALSSLLGMAQADREFDASSVRIFDGSDKRCGRAILGIKNCCKDSGVILSLGLGSCSDQELELAHQKEENRCVYVGSYCSKKAFFGACLKKKQTYCCYEAEIGKVIAEAGKAQLGTGFGSAKEPECGGFTPEQFQQLDLSNVDFSSVTASTMQDLNVADPTALQDQFMDRIGGMTNPGNGG